MPGVWNLFAIGREKRKEDQLTEMLAWLIDAVPEVGAAIVALVFDDAPVDGDRQVTTQYGIAAGRLDALVVDSMSALVIESKIDSDFGDDQVSRYLRWLADHHERRERRGLMTLTAQPMSWKPDDIVLAHELKIVRAERRWEELHALLEQFTESSDGEQLAGRLVGEFLEMLGEEGLVPMKPLTTDEYTTWSQAWAAVRRFHDFFMSCREAIAVEIGATASSKSTNEGYVWQDYVHPDGSKIVVGLSCSDDGRVPRSSIRDTPILWLAVEAKHWPDWSAAMDRLDASTPAGWRSWKRWWGERPQIWRYLDDVIEDGTFEAQRQQLASACAVATTWLANADLRARDAGVPS